MEEAVIRESGMALLFIPRGLLQVSGVAWDAFYRINVITCIISDLAMIENYL
jgi:hypothetical protein